MSKFLITGATGFIGSNLCTRLVKEKHEVCVICRKTSDLSILEGVLPYIDVFIYNDIETLINYVKAMEPDCVFHIAGLIISEHKVEDIYRLMESNIKFSLEILETMRMAGIKNIINTGTSMQHYQDEEDTPASLYGATKQAVEDLLKFYNKAYNFKAITLKIFTTYGENDDGKRFVNALKQAALNNEKLRLTEGRQKMDLIHVDDVVNAYLCAWELLNNEQFSGYESYAVCTGTLITLREVVELFESVNDIKLNVSFGEKPYREREVMNPWSNYKLLPNWKSEITLKVGLRRVGTRINKE